MLKINDYKNSLLNNDLLKIAHNRDLKAQLVMYRETLFIRKTCLSETSCFEIIISHI